MAALYSRRGVLLLAGAAALAGCGGVTPYADQGPANLQLVQKSLTSGLFRPRAVYLDVWTGPKGPNMEYLGTRKFEGASGAVGLPTGRPLHLAIAFEEGGGLLSSGTYTQTVEIPTDPIRPGQMYRLTVAFDSVGYDWDMQRVR